MMDLVIVSMHEKGFPQADFYADHGETDPSEFEAISPSPDDFFTMKKTDALQDAFNKAKDRWPNARIVAAANEDDED